jgi:hypothetical protein
VSTKSLRDTFASKTEIEPQGVEVQAMKQALDRNQIERLRLKATIVNNH